MRKEGRKRKETGRGNRRQRKEERKTERQGDKEGGRNITHTQTLTKPWTDLDETS